MHAPGMTGDPTASAARAPVLSVSGLCKHFGGRPALMDVSFTLEARAFAAVLGPSGVGKSTLFRCIAGLESYDSGELRFENRDLRKIRQIDRRRIAVVYQQFNLVKRLTALENVLAGRLGHVAWWRGALRRFERADRLKALECLERVGLLEFARQRADTLSGGQQQRVAIARALAQEPRLIIADEPVASLDPVSAAGVLQLLKDIANTEGVAVLTSLHQLAYARAYADRIIGMSGGKIVLDSRTGDLDEAALANLYQSASRPSGIAEDPADGLVDVSLRAQGAQHGADFFAHARP